MRDLNQGDVELIRRQREAMLREAGNDEQILHTMTVNVRAWLRPRLEDGTYWAWLG